MNFQVKCGGCVKFSPLCVGCFCLGCFCLGISAYCLGVSADFFRVSPPDSEALFGRGGEVHTDFIPLIYLAPTAEVLPDAV